MQANIFFLCFTVDKRGNLFSRVFGTRDFWGNTAVSEADGKREGLFASLQASMTVPGATGPPVNIKDAWGRVIPCFDAFCFEPIPYRSAVEEGATHVLALCSRPEGFDIKTKPGVYEQGVAPLYFHSHGQGKVAEYFEKGGQQFVYAEDLLTLEQGKVSPSSKVLVPPPKILYGVKQDSTTRQIIRDRKEQWKRAHLLPLKVPDTTPELSSLEQDYNAVLEAVRGGYAAAFDILAPVVGLELGLNGEEVAELVFPKDDDFSSGVESLLTTQVQAPGFDIADYLGASSSSSHKTSSSSSTALGMEPPRLEDETSDLLAHTVLTMLPGFNGDRGTGFTHLAKGLHYQVNGREVTL